MRPSCKPLCCAIVLSNYLFTPAWTLGLIQVCTLVSVTSDSAYVTCGLGVHRSCQRVVMPLQLHVDVCSGCCAQVSATEVYLVVNAGCREKDLKHINEQLEKYNVRCPAALILPAATRHWSPRSV